jgi:hypothetical protein
MWMWIISGLLIAIIFLLVRINRELHAFAYVTSFNLTLFRRVMAEKVLTPEEKDRFLVAMTDAEKKHFKDL